MKYGRVERAILAGAQDINIQIIQYGDTKALPEGEPVVTEVKVIENNG